MSWRGLTKLVGRAAPFGVWPADRDEGAGTAAGGGAGGAPMSCRFTGALRLWSKPGVRLSTGMGDSACGLNVGTLLGGALPSALCTRAAARDVTKPIGGLLPTEGFGA